ncbi:hypothetical protein RSOLAG1IB_07372 [Rhizoctonia solani AG-1 IB]|uniref:GST N-terminal domain-containing protein n=1 Tax=Thanatephorus cucumeris (strain AG1-IB / isolate 7/3/14) TaxID=1108050 RepID=M5BU94_THACB|nr:hypothetical protein BN14_05342 [Rhizoctonia solani AG-1 IB]CEL54880.1 hypothetical protein RSOLAG1IB_07372 [Rhizoctonia solani AG-1 IB]
MAATTKNPIIFYDLADANSKSWSFNPYKTRLSLNYKHLPYRVVYLSFPDIEPRLKELGMSPVSETFPRYTLPVIADPSADPEGKPTYVSDSFKIALYLDEKYPAPKYPAIFSPGTHGLQSLLMTEYFPTLISAIIPLCLPNLPGILDARSIEHIIRTRGPVAAFEPTSKEAKAEFVKKAQEKLDTLAQSLAHNDGSGPFVLGKQVSFIDFSIGGLLHFVQKSEPEDSTVFDELLNWSDGKWGIYWQGIQQIEKDSSEVTVHG